MLDGRVDERRLGAEEPEDGDLVDAGFLGDAPRRGAEVPPLGVEPEGDLEDSLVGFIHGASIHLLVFHCKYPLASRKP